MKVTIEVSPLEYEALKVEANRVQVLIAERVRKKIDRAVGAALEAFVEGRQK